MTSMKSFRLYLLLLFAALISVGCASGVQAPDGETSSVVMLRHAERTQISKQLTEAGRARAAALPDALKDLPIVAIYSPDRARNLDTAKPLARQRGLEITVVPEEQSWEQVAQRLVSEHPGETVVWVGNRGNLIQLHALLGGQGEPPLEYGEITILRLTNGAGTAMERRHFGTSYFN